ncbi:MAG: protein kinase [Planctomycetota bacterium]
MSTEPLPQGPGDPLAGSKSSETVWDAAPKRTHDFVVERGWVPSAAAEQALLDYEEQSTRQSFSSYLVERGLLSLSQVAELEREVGDVGAPVRAIAAGTVFSGCKIVRKLGEGGMGTVYLATREADGLAVVVKFLAAKHAKNPVWRTRFLREAMVARKVAHPNVVGIYGVEVEGSQPHIVMELVEGADLEERLKREGRLPPAEVARIGREVALGLAAAHAQGVIHRDVKPGNVRLTAAGAVKILDFGLAKAIESDDGVSLAGQVLGTPYYMAPEQWGDHMVDPRTDVFSLGATLYHLLTGQVPYPGKQPMTVCRRAGEGKPERPSSLVDDLPQGLELAILRMLAVDRRARYHTAAECAEALAAALAGQPVHVPSLTDQRRGEVFPLVPANVYVLGRGEDADIPLRDGGASRSHARIRLGPVGYQLVDLDSSYGTFVNEMRVGEVLLKSGDLIRCGKQVLRFDDGGARGKERPEPAAESNKAARGELLVSTLPEPFLDFLVAAHDKRAVIPLLEQLPQEAVDQQVESTRAFLREHYGGALAEDATRALRERLMRRRRQSAHQLFEVTFENLQDDVEAWLTWWDEHRHDYPPQLGPQRLRPRARLRVTAGTAPQVFELSERMRTTIGRGTENDVCLDERSLSRHHATVLRLNQRLMVRDDGSRFGTRVRGEPRASAFLADGDAVALGRVELRCEVEDLEAKPPRTPQGLYLVDPELFDVLVEQRHPAAAAGLFGFLRFTRDLAWVDRQAARLFGPSAEVQACAEAVRAAYAARRARALELLPALVPALAEVPPGEDGEAWGERLGRAHLPAQLLPVGWFKPTA